MSDIFKDFASATKTEPARPARLANHPAKNIPERTLPNSPESERGLLGALLRDNRAIGDCIAIVKPLHFYGPANRLVYEAIIHLFDNGTPADVVTIAEELKKRNQVEEVGGYVYLAELFDTAATAANSVYYAKIVRDKGELRKLILTAQAIATEGYAAAGEADEIIHAAVRQMLGVADSGVIGTYHPIDHVLNETYDRIDSRKGLTGTTGVPSGFIDLDTLTSGFQDGEMVIIAARPSVGKTAFALDMAKNIAVGAKQSVLFISLEMARVELAERMLAAHASIDMNHIRRGALTHKDTTELIKAGDEIRSSPLFIDDSTDATILKIAAKARTLKQTKGLRAIFIDYIQLIQPEDRRAPRQEQVAQISRRTKMLARELGIPVIVLAQINRNSEEREGNIPRISDLRESGSLEQDADTVMLLHRPDRLNPGERMGEIDVIIAKQRSGPTGTVTLKFERSKSKFTNLTTISPFDRL